MKTCPVCGSICFDDMPTCFGCMHRFSSNDPKPTTDVRCQNDSAEEVPADLQDTGVMSAIDDTSVDHASEESDERLIESTDEALDPTDPLRSPGFRKASSSKSFVVRSSMSNMTDDGEKASVEVPLIATPLVPRRSERRTNGCQRKQDVHGSNFDAEDRACRCSSGHRSRRKRTVELNGATMLDTDCEIVLRLGLERR